MALDVTKFILSKGTLTYTKTGGTAQAIGFTVQGLNVALMRRYDPVLPEEFGDIPADYIDLGGPIIVTGEPYQWDDATRHAIGPHFISSSDLEIGAAGVGETASSQSAGTLTFIPDKAGMLAMEATRAVVISGEESNLNVGLRRRQMTTFAFAFGLTPDPSASNRQVRFYTYAPTPP